MSGVFHAAESYHEADFLYEEHAAAHARPEDDGNSPVDCGDQAAAWDAFHKGTCLRPLSRSLRPHARAQRTAAGSSSTAATCSRLSRSLLLTA